MDERAKLAKLEEFLRQKGRVAVAFSGGVDSTFLLEAAHRVLGENVLALTAQADWVPRSELEEAKNFCRSKGIRQILCRQQGIAIEGFAENPPDRCYICKRVLFSQFKDAAEREGFSAVMEGSNLDDEGDYRPGMRAVAELGILSPLRVAGLTKEEIRSLSKEWELSTWEKPSYACLASRFAYGETITSEKLYMVEQAEELLKSLGIGQARVRIHGRMARIEVLSDDFSKVIRDREQIVSKFKSYGFSYVSMDLQGYRTGSMNEELD